LGEPFDFVGRVFIRMLMASNVLDKVEQTIEADSGAAIGSQVKATHSQILLMERV
jgi:hypothetical protein